MFCCILIDHAEFAIIMLSRNPIRVREVMRKEILPKTLEQTLKASRKYQEIDNDQENCAPQ